MAHHEVELETTIARGTRVGPSFDNTIIRLNSGQVESVQRSDLPRRRFEVAYDIKRPAAANELRDFIIARHGSGASWNIKDWTDCASTASGTLHHTEDQANPISMLDQPLGTGDGVTPTFQIVKKLTSGLQTVTRPIHKIRAGSVVVAEDTGGGAALVSPSAYSVNLTTGQITFTVPPASGAVLTDGFEFLVPVRCTESVDEWLDAVMAGFDYRELPPLEVMEEIIPDTVSDDVPPLGAMSHGAITASVSISQSQGVFHYFTQTTGGLDVSLPAIAGHYQGVAYVLSNQGTTTLTIKDAALNVIGTIPPGVTVDVLVADSGGSETWVIA